MDSFHAMLPEDEFLICAYTLLAGIMTGAVARCIAALRGRRAA